MTWLLLNQLYLIISEPRCVLEEVISSELLSVSVLLSEHTSMKTTTSQVLSLAYCNQRGLRREARS